MQQHFLKLKSAVIYQGVFPPVKGANGGDRRVRDFCIGLAHVSEQTYMLVPKWQDKGINSLDKQYFEVVYLDSLCSGFPIMNKFFFWIAVCKFVIQERIEIILCYGSTFECIPFIYYLRKSIHVVIGHEMSDLASYSTKGLTKLIYKLNENLIPKFVDFTVGISDLICAHFIKVNSQAISVKVPILVDRTVFKSSESRRKIYRAKHSITDQELLIAYVGATHIDEGVGNLMSVVKELQLINPHLKLLVASNYVQNNPTYDDVIAIAERMNKELLILPGWVSTDEVLDIYSASDILVVPQVKNMFNKAALPTKLAEYSSIGRAAVIASVGDINQYFIHRKHAMLYEASDLEGLKTSLEELVNDEKLRNDLSIGIQELAINVFENKNAGLTIMNGLKKKYKFE
jgi:glycosyltransferase involved in cell wall biosynthesis